MKPPLIGPSGRNALVVVLPLLLLLLLSALARLRSAKPPSAISCPLSAVRPAL